MAENEFADSQPVHPTGETLPGTRGRSGELRERLARFETATASLLDGLSRTQALLDDAARIVEPGFQRVNGAGREPPRSGAGRRDGSGEAVLSLAEVSVRTGRHPDLLRRWSESGRIPAIRVGRSWAIPESVLATVTWPASRKKRNRRATSAEPPEHEQADGRSIDVEG